MKELEKVKRISIATILFILAILIGVLTFERPKNIFTYNTKTTLEKLTTTDYLISIDEIDLTTNVLIDVRSQFEFEKGHLENAINMATPEILSDENQAILNEIKDKNKTIVIYGNNAQEANIPFMMLFQLGFDDIKLLRVELDYLQNKLVTNNEDVEMPITNIKAFIDESRKNSTGTDTLMNSQSNVPKKIITVQKKKKRAAEGGC
jgi:rhodanese-related sulfurtransferase